MAPIDVFTTRTSHPAPQKLAFAGKAILARGQLPRGGGRPGRDLDQPPKIIIGPWPGQAILARANFREMGVGRQLFPPYFPVLDPLSTPVKKIPCVADCFFLSLSF